MAETEGSFHAAREMRLPKSFSMYHGRLLDLCLVEMGAIPGKRNTSQPPMLEREGDIITPNDLVSLATMVEIEFIESLKQELNGSETSEQAEPHVFDIFLMQATLQSLAPGRARTSRPIAICVPYKKKLMWWDGFSTTQGGQLWPLQPKSHMRKLSSLSGSARILQALADARNLCSHSESLVAAAMKREKILKVDPLDCGFLPYTGANLNQAQHQAVHALSYFDLGFFCIQGPPGCGKTTTMVEMIMAAKTRSSVIVVAPSNAAVANVALKLYDTGLVPFGRMAVFGENCHDSVRFLQPKFRSQEYTTFCDKYEKALKVPEGNEPSVVQTATAKKLFTDMLEWLHLPGKDGEEWSLSDIAKECPTLQLEDDGSLSMQAQRKFRDLLGKADVVFCTLNSAGSFTLQSTLADADFHTLMLDEGGQCTEAEFFIAATFPGIQRVVVMGDPKQLRPTVISMACAENGFGDSFLGQLYKKDPQSLHLLDTQYRMDPIILRFPNIQFYRGRIKNGENVNGRKPMVEYPFMFEDTARKGQEMKTGFSWRNQYEASVINVMLRSDTDIRCLLQAGVGGETKVIIITPYRSQMALLQEQIQLPKGSKARIIINTVDAFQGQEGDVVIVSTVRTRRAGFVDNAQRLNVALTRAKRVLRVVGELSFFQQLDRNSTLRALALYASKHDLVRKSKISRLRHCPPDWTAPTAWSITLTQRFHHCIRELKNETEKNYCLNTLFALATPNLASLQSGRVSETMGWKMNSFNDVVGKQLCVVWIAKTNGEKPTIEAHFAGRREDALQFQQLNFHRLPRGSRVPKRDMSGILQTEDIPADGTADGTSSFIASWRLDNSMQDVILSNTIEEMPFSFLELDPAQKLVAHSAAPLMIESRSGTGKTLVLLQHAALMTRQNQYRHACFVTVSPRLKEELKKKYAELRPVLFTGLPPTDFFTYRSLLEELVEVFKITEFDDCDICTLDSYYGSKRSYNHRAIDPKLVQNEIGGVIMGSVDAAILRRPLSRTEYLENKRSNIPTKTTDGERMRIFVYEEYEKYSAWKQSNNKYDLSDVVLRLLDRDLPQYFSGAYLDEVQDLSHAAIYLICHIAGRQSQNWVCAGDPAQMISPGCSFTFDGLKQTLLAVTPGIESKLRRVHHLIVNYRTTKDILVMANTILDLAKKTFPGSIEYAAPERAVKDLGLRVVTCNWQDAMTTTVKFGGNQVLIYSPSDSATIPTAAKQWLNDHPFILSSLDSKGLEFDDVVVAFQVDRKYWDLSRKHDTSLTMLRELYVAVTRAQRRVLILIEPGNDNMKAFFRDLGCEEIPAGTILQEFNQDTTKEEWHQRGLELFESERFDIAASCFARADQPGWACLATANAKLRMGLNEEAEACFTQAAFVFFEQQQCTKVLDVLEVLLSISKDWDPSLNAVFSSSLAQMPRHLSKYVVIQFHLKRDNWQMIRCADLCDSNLSHVFSGYRRHKKFKAIIKDASESERLMIESSLPWAHADYHIDQGNHFEALTISLSHRDYHLARECSDHLLADEKWRTAVKNCKSLIRLWNPHAAMAGSAHLRLLLGMFSSPKETASKSGADCLRIFGRPVIREAFASADLDMVELLVFGDRTFNADVLGILERRSYPHLTKVVEFLVDAGYSGLAVDFARRREWHNDDYMRLALIMRVRPPWLLQELEKRHLLRATTQMITCSSKLSSENKQHYKSDLEACYPGNTLPELEQLTLMEVFDAEGPSMELRQRGMYVELAFLFLHLGFFHIAARHSVNALKNIGPKSLGQIRYLWEERLPRGATIRSQQRLLMNLLATCREQVHYMEEETGSGNTSKIVNCDKPHIAFSLQWLNEDRPVNMFLLLKEFGSVTTTYAHVLSSGSHDEFLLMDLMKHQEDLKERLEQQMDRAEGKPKKRRERGAKNVTRVKASPSTAPSSTVSHPKSTNQSKSNTTKSGTTNSKTTKKKNKKKNRRK